MLQWRCLLTSSCSSHQLRGIQKREMLNRAPCCMRQLHRSASGSFRMTMLTLCMSYMCAHASAAALRSQHPVMSCCRALTCKLANGTTVAYDPAGAASARLLPLEDFQAICGHPSDLGYPVSRACNTQYCAVTPWTVSYWDECRVDCTESNFDNRTGLASGWQYRAVRCSASDDSCGGAQPDAARVCSKLCNACAAGDVCGPGGTCLCASCSPASDLVYHIKGALLVAREWGNCGTDDINVIRQQLLLP